MLKVVLFSFAVVSTVAFTLDSQIDLTITNGEEANEVITVRSTDSILRLKEKYECLNDVSIRDQRIFYRGVELENPNTLAYYNIGDRVMLNLQITQTPHMRVRSSYRKDWRRLRKCEKEFRKEDKKNFKRERRGADDREKYYEEQYKRERKHREEERKRQEEREKRRYEIEKKRAEEREDREKKRAEHHRKQVEREIERRRQHDDRRRHRQEEYDSDYY